MKKRMGRPPAKWMYELASLSGNEGDFLDYHDLSNRFGIMLRTVYGFCTKVNLEGEYYKTESHTIRKRFTIKVLRKATQESVEK